MIKHHSTPGLVIVLVFVCAVTSFFGSVGSQNCGFPSSPIHLNPVLEDTTPGQVLESIRAVHLSSAEYDLTCSSPQLDPEATFPFIRIITTTPGEGQNQNDTQPLITLYLHQDANLGLLIDFFKVTSCEVRADIKCSDGKKKVATFIIPLTDLNTKPPTFALPVYNFNVPLPWHSEVPLNYDKTTTSTATALAVEDQDRDCQNTEIEASVLMPVGATLENHVNLSSWFSVVSHREARSSNTCEQEQKQESNSKFIRLGKYTDQHHRHVISIYLQPHVSSHELASHESLTVLVHARNLNPYSNSTENSSTAVVNIHFSLAPLDFSPPQFSHPVYECSIHNLDPSGLSSVRINATDPDELTGVRYEILDECGVPNASASGNARNTNANASEGDGDFLDINAYTGELSFKRQLTPQDVEQFSHAVGVFHIKAVQNDTNLRYSVATLLIYFEFDEYEPSTTTTKTTSWTTTTTSSSPITTTASWTTTTSTPTTMTTTTSTSDPEPSTTTETEWGTTNQEPTTEPDPEPSTTEWTEASEPTGPPGPTSTSRPSTPRPTRPTRPTDSTPGPTTPEPSTSEPEPTQSMPTTTTTTTTTAGTTTTTTTTEPPECVNLPDSIYCNRYFSCEPMRPSLYLYTRSRAYDIGRGYNYTLRSMCCSRDVLHLIYCHAKDTCIYPEEVDDLCPGCRGFYDESCTYPEKPGTSTTTTMTPPDDDDAECNPGSFVDQAHPRYCNRFLSCRDNGHGEMITEPMCCPVGHDNEPYLVYCERENRCMVKAEWDSEVNPCRCNATEFDPRCLSNPNQVKDENGDGTEKQPLDLEFDMESTSTSAGMGTASSQLLTEVLALMLTFTLLVTQVPL